MHETHDNKPKAPKPAVATWAGTAAVCLALALGAGCSPQHYRRSADRQVYTILKAKSSSVPGMLQEFSIERPTEPVVPAIPGPAEAAAGEETTEAPLVITLEKALEIASLNNRQYQSQKESLYLSGLSLTAQRYRFAPHFSGRLSGDYQNTDSGDSEEVGAASSFGLSWLLSTGAQLSVGLSSSFSQFLTGDTRRAASSLFSATITQPLLQGAGVPVMESLTQAERDVIYQMRNFVRYRRTFFVSVLSEYYRVLQKWQVLQNELNNYQNLTTTRERYEEELKAGKIAGFEVDRFRQDELRAEDRLEAAQQSYEAALDAVKITLGLPMETNLMLEPAELDLLTEQGVVPMESSLGRLVEIALENRLDFMNGRDSVEDAKRKVDVAKNDLLPGLDLSASLGTDTEGTSKPLNFQGDRTDFTAGFELDLPLDKLSERNSYRSRLITLDRRRRDLQELRDEVVEDVRDALRQYSRAGRSYEIQKTSVVVAKRREESAELRLEAGRAEAQDLLDARDDLIQAQNDFARATVDYKVARLSLAADMGILVVDDKGQLKENFEAYE